jgi:uncharacterized protein YkwD
MRMLVPQLVVGATLLAAPPAVASAPCPSPPVPRTAAATRTARAAVLCLLNRERALRGLAGLTESRRLRAAAFGYAGRMVRRQYFAHDRTGMTRRIRRTGFLRHHRYWTIGENLGWGSGTIGAPAGMVRAWMASPPHRRNILNRSFRQIGIGVVAGVPLRGVHGATYVTDFGSTAW